MPNLVPPDSAKGSAAELLKWAKEQGAIEFDVRFTDFRGIPQHVTRPIVTVDADSFEDGFGFDGSSIKGFQNINASDMLLLADLSTAYIDPFFKLPTLAVKCDVVDPITRDPYPNDTRGFVHRAQKYLESTGIADTAYFGPEAEFFIFSNLSYDNQPNHTFFEIDSHEAFWDTGSKDPRRTYMNRVKEGYFPLPPNDKIHDIRAQMVQTMMSIGVEVEVHHHEVASAAQAEIDMRYDTILRMADKLIDYKYVVRNVAALHNMVAVFMPKPIFGDNGSGMHVHQSLWKGGKPLFGGDLYAGLSQTALWYIGGVLKHAKALLAITNPTTNSYRRLVPGYEAPVNLVYSARNRSAAIRIPMYSNNPKAKRIETRFPDPTANPYLAFPALMLAGLDGIINKIDPGQPFEMDLYEADVETPTTPPGLADALRELEKDHEFLLQGGVFTREWLEMYVAYKQKEEADAVAMRPHPYEFKLYLDF
jgi:glutamine synthetase